MRQKIASALLILLCCIPSRAQSLEEFIRENPDRAGNIYHRYETFSDGTLTPAPKGYHPVYISHYGRHGSRYHSDIKKFFTRPLSDLQILKDNGILSSKGQELLEDLQAISNAHEGLEGILTQVGSKEHYEIASRMYDRFPEVFKNGSKEITAVSSTFQRCIQSLSNFTLALKGRQEDLDFHIYTGEKYMNYICHSAPYKNEYVLINHIQDSLCREIDGSRMLNLISTDPQRASEVMQFKPYEFVNQIFYAGSIVQCIEYPLPDLYGKYLTIEELILCSRADNTRMYAAFGESDELPDFRTNSIGTYLLADILSKADEALEHNDKAADLRFGHDTGLAPFLFLIGIEGYDMHMPMADAGWLWLCSKQMCMGSNIQFIFYRNRKGNILVKILHNERETTIPVLSPCEGPYYEWTELRRYLADKMKNQK